MTFGSRCTVPDAPMNSPVSGRTSQVPTRKPCLRSIGVSRFDVRPRVIESARKPEKHQLFRRSSALLRPYSWPLYWLR